MRREFRIQQSGNYCLKFVSKESAVRTLRPGENGFQAFTPESRFLCGYEEPRAVLSVKNISAPETFCFLSAYNQYENRCCS